uniref:DNA repair protein RadA n=1 Tax=Eubacterium cellulosolvens TaxID=29322 RepID=UPI00047F39D1|nr:DNA repair protein RadA [[Eubacterium] cellulosolvens]
MKEKKSVFYCQNCGYESSKWMGQCPACHEWNTFVEEVVSEKKTGKKASGSAARSEKNLRPKSLSEIDVTAGHRMETGIGELDRVLGGGIVKGALMLIGGDPGIGKSTLLLQVCRELSDKGVHVLYVSGEESLQQIKLRALRIGEFTDNLKLYCETDLDDIQNVIENTKPELVVIDSIQTMYNEAVSSSPGSVSQVRETTAVLLRMAKSLQVPVFIVGHVTKDGNVAGPRVLEHMVDTVLYFEGDRNQSYRILRAAKNRFGSTNEIGVFEMRSEGLEEVKNPSEYMLDGRPEDASGSVVACSMEGSRPIMIEIQALVSRTNFNFPRRTANGTDFNRVNLLMAVLEKRARINLSQSDAYINITGGVRMSEPAVDLAIVLALASSHKDVPVPADTVVFGEVGLSGEIRSVTMAEQRVREAAKLGFGKVILPNACMRSLEKLQEELKIRMYPVRNVREAIDCILR